MKRTPLVRKTPLRGTQLSRSQPIARSGGSLPRTPITQRVSARLRASRGTLASNRPVVLSRDDQACARCGTARDLQLHHRLPRGMGGSSRRLDAHCPSVLLTLCATCHQWVECNRRMATDLGLLVPRGMTPARCPVRYWHGWYLLDPNGTRRRVTVETEGEVL